MRADCVIHIHCICQYFFTTVVYMSQKGLMQAGGAFRCSSGLSCFHNAWQSGSWIIYINVFEMVNMLFTIENCHSTLGSVFENRIYIFSSQTLSISLKSSGHWVHDCMGSGHSCDPSRSNEKIFRVMGGISILWSVYGGQLLCGSGWPLLCITSL